MIFEHYKKVIAIAIVLLAFGCIMPFLIVIDVIQPTLFLLFFVFGSSALGLFLGLAGVAGIHAKEKHRKNQEELYK